MKPMTAITKGPPQIYRRVINVVEEVLTVLTRLKNICKIYVLIPKLNLIFECACALFIMGNANKILLIKYVINC